NSVMRIASTTSATVRARSRLLRASPPPFCAAGFCSAVDIARRSYPSAAPDRALAPRAAIRFEHDAARTSRRRARAWGVGGGASGASAVLRARGFTPKDISEYHRSQTLRVLVGIRTGSSDGHIQQAFFFVNDRYIGTDAKAPSATVKVVSQGDTEVTLAYSLY